MSSSYTTGTLGLELVARGEQAGTWDTGVNKNFKDIDQAVSGVTSFAVSGATYTFAGNGGTPDTADAAVIVITSATVNCTITVPAAIDTTNARVYAIVNKSSFVMTIKVGTGTTTTTVAANNSGLVIVLVNDVYSASSPAAGGSDASAITSGVFATARIPPITTAMMTALAANTMLGNNTGSSATPIALTGAQVKTLLAVNNSDIIAAVGGYTLWSGTQAAYDVLGTYPSTTLYFIHA
jgi:hypothetical protein